MVFKKSLAQKIIKRDTVPINSPQSDGTINISHNSQNISNISLTINNSSQKMYQIKQLLLLMLFGASIVNFTLTILNTQNIAVNTTLLQQVNTTKAIITKDVLRIYNHLSGMDSWKYILKLLSYFDRIFPQISKLFEPIFVFISTKQMCLIPICGICTQMILSIFGRVARFRNILGCILWGYTLYLQDQRALVEDNILSRVLCSTLILFLTVQILLTSQQGVKVYNLNITDTSPKSSKIRINKRNLFSKDTNNRFELNNDTDKKNIHFFNNLDQNNIYRSNENLFLGSESKSLFNEPLKFDDLIKTSPKNTIEINKNPIDTYCDSLKNLKLSTNANFILNNKVNPHFRQKEYNVKQVPDIFVKKSVFLSPTRFPKVSQESWVAGGYWKHYDQCEFVTSQFKSDQILFKNLTPLSRSSSQSSGFSSQSGDQNSIVESTNSFRTSTVNSKFCLPLYDDRLSVRSEPAYHSNI